MRTFAHRRAQKDFSTERQRLWVQRASEAPDGQDHDLPGYDARRVLRESRDCAQSLFLKYSWNSDGTGYVTVRHDSEVKGSRDSGPRN